MLCSNTSALIYELWAARSGCLVIPRSRMLDPALADALGDALRTPTAKHDLLLFMIEHTDGTTEFQLEFDTDIIDRPTAETWLAYLERFARAVADSRARDAAE